LIPPATRWWGWRRIWKLAKWLLLAVTLIGIGVMLWARIDDHRKGLR
jgi:hypothetical protein